MKRSIGAHTILHPTPVMVVGTYDDNGRPNIMTVAWGGICCSKPPSVSISIREATYTYGSIMKNRAFTVNIPSTNHLKAADYAGTYSGKSEDKFKSLKLTPVKSEFVNAPCVREFPYALECRLAYTLNVGLHTMFIGEIVNITADEEILGKEGMPDIEKVRPLIYCTDSKSYYSVGKQVSKAFLSKKLG